MFILFTELLFKCQKISMIKKTTLTQILVLQVSFSCWGKKQTCYNSIKNNNNKRKARMHLT